MSGRLLSLVMAFAYRRARRYGAPVWWAVLALAFLVRAADQRVVQPRRYRVRSGQELDVVVETPTPR